MSRKTVLKVVHDLAFSRSAYLRAKVLNTLSSNCHEQAMLFRSLGQEEMSEAFSEASSVLHAEARRLFPLYPHPDFIVGQDWARNNGFDE